MSVPITRNITWMIWIVASLFYAYQYVLRVMPNILLGDIMQRFQIDATTVGQFSGIYYISYSLMHLPMGILLDRFGPKRVLSSSILLTVLGLLTLAFQGSFALPLIGRFLVGLGSSAAILGVFKVIRMAFREEQFSRLLGFSVTIGLIGAIYGGGPVDYMHKTLGYEAVISVFAIIGVGLALASYVMIPSLKQEVSSNPFSDIKEVLSNKRVIGVCLLAGLMVGPLEGFADVWASAFLRQVCHIESSLAASLPSLIFIGMCLGAPLLSWIAEKTGHYLLVIAGAGVVMALSFAVAMIYPLSSTLLSVNFMLIGIGCAYQILAIYKVSTYVREGVAGLATASANMIIMLFGYFFHTLVGMIIQACGGPSHPSALLYGISVIPLCLVLSAIGFTVLLLRDRQRLPT
jgi:predicted MFS family arabinose efflux permease